MTVYVETKYEERIRAIRDILQAVEDRHGICIEQIRIHWETGKQCNPDRIICISVEAQHERR